MCSKSFIILYCGFISHIIFTFRFDAIIRIFLTNVSGIEWLCMFRKYSAVVCTFLLCLNYTLMHSAASVFASWSLPLIFEWVRCRDFGIELKKLDQILMHLDLHLHWGKTLALFYAVYMLFLYFCISVCHQFFVKEWRFGANIPLVF